MTDDEPKSPRWELVKLVIRSQSSWIVGALGIAAAIMTFVAIGEWGLLWLLIALLVIALIAQHRYMASRVSVATAASTASNHAEDPATAHSPDAQNVDNEYSVGEPQTEDVTADPLAESSEESRNEGEFPAAVEAATRGDLRATREHATTWIEEAEEEEDRHKRRVLREMLLSRAGDESALTRLGQLADARPNDPWTQQMFALDLEHNGALRRAAEEVEERTEAMKDGNGRTALLTVEARIRRKLGELERAQECCRLALAEAKTESTALAHRIMGECWSDEGQPFLALAHWTESLQENPNDGYLRFEVAYKASNEGLDDLSIMYYLVLDRTDRASSVAQNNLGVELRARQAIFTGTDYWRKAAERGSALAAGNIANVLVAGGFASEALEWAERGRTMDDE